MITIISICIPPDDSRLGVIVAMAAGGIVILLLMTLIMYACCKGYKGKLLPQRETQQGTVSAIYNPTILYRHGK